MPQLYDERNGTYILYKVIRKLKFGNDYENALQNEKKNYTHVYMHFGIMCVKLSPYSNLSGADEQTGTFQTALLMCIRTTW